jgi:hypothetical protein
MQLCEIPIVVNIKITVFGVIRQCSLSGRCEFRRNADFMLRVDEEMEAIFYSDTSVSFHQITGRGFPENLALKDMTQQ